MLVASDQGLRKILRGKLALGADMSVSAGPVGKGKEIATDTALKAEAFRTRAREVSSPESI